MKARMTGIINLAGWVAALIFCASLSVSALAQAPPGAGPPPNTNPNFDDRVRTNREATLRSAEVDAHAAAENEKQIQAAIVNMKQDFARIQVLRNDIARDLVAHKPLDYTLVTEQTSEINKRARRLNVYVLARVPDDKEPGNLAELQNEEMIGALVKLCKLIDSFVENPALKVATVDANDVEKRKLDKAKADKDLLAIIELSSRIQKKTDSLKTPK